MKREYLVNMSTTTSMVSLPSDLGRAPVKSMVMCCHAMPCPVQEVVVGGQDATLKPMSHLINLLDLSCIKYFLCYNLLRVHDM
jgi:hypothetical protein